MYVKLVALMGNLYLKGLNSKKSKNNQAKTTASGFPTERPNFCL